MERLHSDEEMFKKLSEKGLFPYQFPDSVKKVIMLTSWRHMYLADILKKLDKSAWEIRM